MSSGCYINIVQKISESDDVPDLVKEVLNEMRQVVQDLEYEKFMLECDILDVEDALQGKSITWNSVKSAERCEKILKLLGDKK